MSDQPLPPDITALAFEDALKELETIVRQLEEGRVDLEASIDLYGRGALLKRHCEDKLAAAKARVDKIVAAADGSVGTRPLDVD